MEENELEFEKGELETKKTESKDSESKVEKTLSKNVNQK